MSKQDTTAAILAGWAEQQSEASFRQMYTAMAIVMRKAGLTLIEVTPEDMRQAALTRVQVEQTGQGFTVSLEPGKPSQ